MSSSGKPNTCADCGATPPPADSSYTVIGHGWRVHRRVTADGMEIVWQCGACWRNSRARAKSEVPNPTKPTGTGPR